MPDTSYEGVCEKHSCFLQFVVRTQSTSNRMKISLLIVAAQGLYPGTLANLPPGQRPMFNWISEFFSSNTSASSDHDSTSVTTTNDVTSAVSTASDVSIFSAWGTAACDHQVSSDFGSAFPSFSATMETFGSYSDMSSSPLIGFDDI